MIRFLSTLAALVVVCASLAGCAGSGSDRAGAAGPPATEPTMLSPRVPPATKPALAATASSAVSAATAPATLASPPALPPAAAPTTTSAPAPAVPCAGYDRGGPVVPVCRPGTAGGPADVVVAEVPDTNLRVNQAWAGTIARFRADGLGAGFDLQGAKQMGLDLGSHRSAADQQELVDKGFPAAPAGRSMHEWGLAVDWSCDGKLFGDPANRACRAWVQANAPAHGLMVLGHEPWHWSPNGR